MLSSKNTFKLLLKNLSIISVYDPSYAKKKKIQENFSDFFMDGGIISISCNTFYIF